MISFSILSKRRGATLAGVFSLALSCVVLLCGAGSVPIENLLPKGAMQGDLNAGGHSLTNAGTVSATNVVVSGSLTAPSSFTLPFSMLTSTPTTLAGYGITDPIVLTSGSYANPAWLTSLAYSKLTGAPSSSITLNTHSVSLGGSLSLTYTDVGADASGAAAAAQTYSTNYANTNAAAVYVPKTTTVNGQPLSGNVTVTNVANATNATSSTYATTAGTATNVGTGSYSTSPSLPVANVKAYGATGNGTTDDTSAINSALAAAPAVYFPAGTYLVSNLTVNANNFLFGDGQASIIKMKSGATGYVIYGNGFAYSVENLAFLGQNNTSFSSTSSPGSQSCLHIDATQNNQVFHAVYIAGFNNMAIGVNGDQSATHQGPALTDLYMNNDWCAIDTGPSGTGQTTALGGANGGEYLTIKGIHATNCYYGCVADSGNVAWIGCNMTYDYCGFYLNSAANGSHGSFCESVCNHSTYGIIANGAGSYGYIVGHDYFLGSGADYITITNTAVTIDHCEFTEPVTFLVSANAANEVVTLDSNIWNGAPPTIVNSSSNPATVLWSGLNQVTQVSTLNGYANLASPLQTDSGVSETPNYGLGTAITVTNPNFATTGGWTSYVSGWTIAGTGYATSSGSSGVIYQGLSGTTNFATYQVTFTISSYVSGSVNLDMGGAYQIADGTYNGRTPLRSANGTYTEICTQDTTPNIVIYSHAFSGSITGITVKPITSILPGTWNCGAISQTAPQTTVSGSSGGTATFSEPLTGSTCKKVIIFENGLSGTASYTYPTAFTNTPLVVNSDSTVTSNSTTAVTVTGTGTTKTVILEGY